MDLTYKENIMCENCKELNKAQIIFKLFWFIFNNPFKINFKKVVFGECHISFFEFDYTKGIFYEKYDGDFLIINLGVVNFCLYY